MNTASNHKATSQWKAFRGNLTRILLIAASAYAIVKARDLVDYLFPHHSGIARGAFVIGWIAVWGIVIWFFYKKDQNKRKSRRQP